MRAKIIGICVLLIAIALLFLMDAWTTRQYINNEEKGTTTPNMKNSAHLWGVTIPLIMGIALVLIGVGVIVMSSGKKPPPPNTPMPDTPPPDDMV